jgi:hypothetical protein
MTQASSVKESPMQRFFCRAVLVAGATGLDLRWDAG